MPEKDPLASLSAFGVLVPNRLKGRFRDVPKHYERVEA